MFSIRMFFKDMGQNTLEKKSNIEYLEQAGWNRFFPKSVTESFQVTVLLVLDVKLQCV